MMKERDNIEELILNNREGLNENEPMDGHFARFEEKLKSQHKKRRITFNVIWKVAVAVIFVLLATNQAFIYFSPNQQNLFFNSRSSNQVTLASVSAEYEEVEFYFSNAINVGLNQWNALNDDGYISAEEQEMMDNELAEFEERFKALQKDLAANPKDERVVNAMLEYYRTKLSVINMIVNKLEEVKQNNNNHETNI
ncbi:MAG: hypothetical protein L3J54_00335 [Draconibacterium sp.]|nr:hypothetical protein [Draconibacterium sp.]